MIILVGIPCSPVFEVESLIREDSPGTLVTFGQNIGFLCYIIKTKQPGRLQIFAFGDTQLGMGARIVRLITYAQLQQGWW